MATTTRTVPISDLDEQPDSFRVPAEVVQRMLGIGHSTLWRWPRQGRLPQPIRMSNVTSWSLGSIRQFVRELEQASEQQAAAKRHAAEQRQAEQVAA